MSYVFKNVCNFSFWASIEETLSKKPYSLFLPPKKKKKSGFKNIYCNKKKKTKTLMSSILNVIMKATTPPNLSVWYHFNLLNHNSYVTFHHSSIFWGFSIVNLENNKVMKRRFTSPTTYLSV